MAEGANEFDFNFGPQSIAASGTNFMMWSSLTVGAAPAQVPALGPWALPGVALVMSAIATSVSGPYVPSSSRACLSGGSSAFPSTGEPDPNLGT